MSDMRATERLLEVIENRAASIESGADGLSQHAVEQAGQIIEEIQELRRRGDTLVRGRDLEFALGLMEMVDAEEQAVHDRLETALGGRVFGA